MDIYIFILAIRRLKFNGYLLTICCKEVEKIATQAQRKPLALTLTSVTVQTPTPTTTTTAAILTSLE